MNKRKTNVERNGDKSCKREIVEATEVENKKGEERCGEVT